MRTVPLAALTETMTVLVPVWSALAPEIETEATLSAATA